jgi:hypothetical protein
MALVWSPKWAGTTVRKVYESNFMRLILVLGNAFGCKINESIVLDTAKAMVEYGLRDLGYNYVIVDDCWSQGRNDSGYLVEDTVKFPNVSSLSNRRNRMLMNCRV